MINRHNYEEFFLMYVDNELTAQQRADVELFVRQNPDLQKEFGMLLQTRLVADDEIVFAHKTDLLNIKESIGLDNYEEYFLLYIDDELNENGKEAVEKFVLQHPQLQDAFTLLKQAKLPQEKIIFHHKKSLYRKEERRVIPFGFARIAVAAAFIGAAVLIWRLVPVKNNHQPQVAVQQPKSVTTPRIEKHDAVKVVPGAPKVDDQLAVNKTQPTEKKEKQVARTENKNLNRQVEEKKQIVPNNNNNVNNDLASNENKTDENVAVQQSKNNSDNATQTNPVLADVGKDLTKENPVDQTKSTMAMNDRTLGNEIIQPTQYKELNTNDDVTANDDLYIGGMGINKNKVRGFVKKVGGLFAGKAKNSPDDEKGKLQIAGFELNTN